MEASLLSTPHLYTAPLPPSPPTTSSPSQSSSLSEFPTSSQGSSSAQAAFSVQVTPASPGGLSLDLTSLSVQLSSRTPSSPPTPALPHHPMNPSQPTVPLTKQQGYPQTAPYTTPNRSAAHYTTQSTAPVWPRNDQGLNAMSSAYSSSNRYPGPESHPASIADDDGLEGADDADDPTGDMEVDGDASQGQGQGHTGATKGQKNFVSKLWNMVNDPLSDSLIHWTPDGLGFNVTNHVRFAQEQLPLVFKHNNFQSFVRQLNMYDFHKQNRAPRANRGAQEAQHWHFTHIKFIRNRPDLVKEIRRKAPDAGAHPQPYPPPHDPNVGSPVSEFKGGILGASQENPFDLHSKITRLEQANTRLELTNVQLLKAVDELKTKVEQLFFITGQGRTSPLSESSSYSDHNHYTNYGPSPSNNNSTSTTGQHQYQPQQQSSHQVPRMLDQNVPSSTGGSISSASPPPVQYDNTMASPVHPSIQQFPSTVNSSYQGGPINPTFQSMAALHTTNQAQSSSGATLGAGFGNTSFASQSRNTMSMQNAAGPSHSTYSNSATTVGQQATQQSRAQDAGSARAITPTQANPQPHRTHADQAYAPQLGGGTQLGGRGWPVANVPTLQPHNSVSQSPGTSTRGSTNSSLFGFGQSWLSRGS